VDPRARRGVDDPDAETHEGRRAAQVPGRRRHRRSLTIRYTVSIEVDVPRDRFIELFDSVENLKKWQPCLEVFEHISGQPGQPGAKSRMVQRHGKRVIEMVETVTVRELPDLFAGTYEADGVWNEVVNHFSALEGGRTGWKLETEFRCTGFMWLMCNLAPFLFKKETPKFMDRFKTFAESAQD
jgi:hypothetical protein